jgi:hypothetical protein
MIKIDFNLGWALNVIGSKFGIAKRGKGGWVGSGLLPVVKEDRLTRGGEKGGRERVRKSKNRQRGKYESMIFNL